VLYGIFVLYEVFVLYEIFVLYFLIASIYYFPQRSRVKIITKEEALRFVA
jgi:hypothetical protein